MLDAFTSWMYPIRGIYYLVTTPQLLQLVVRFMVSVTIASFVSLVACARLFWEPQLAFLASFLGINLITKIMAALLLLGESAVPIYFIFHERLKKLGERLFDKTLEIKLGRQVIMPAGTHGQTLAAIGLQQPRQSSLTPLHPQEHQALTRMVTMQRQQEADAQQGRSLVVAALLMAARLLFQPRVDEGVVIRKTRDVATVAFTALVPGAALLLPLFVYRDSSVELCDLMARYWQAKGINEGDAQQLLVEHHMLEMRGFGLVATALSYIPVLNWALSLSNHVAAALYAAHFESKGGRLIKKVT